MAITLAKLEEKETGKKATGTKQFFIANKGIFIALGGVTLLGTCYWAYNKVIQKKKQVVGALTTPKPAAIINPQAIPTS